MRLEKSLRADILIASCFLNVLYFLVDEEETVLVGEKIGILQECISCLGFLFMSVALGVVVLKENIL